MDILRLQYNWKHLKIVLIDRTPIIMNEVYVLEAHIEYVLKERIEVIQCSTQAADASIHFEVTDQ